MYTLTVQNARGEQLRLTENERYDVVKVDGICPPPAAINTSPLAGKDGTKFNSSRVEQRNIVITLNIKQPVEINRIELYKYFQVKKYIKIYYKTETRDVYIEGYVETFENNLFGILQQPQISIICPEPFWKSVVGTSVNFSNSIALFEFPFSIPEEGIEFSRLVKSTTAYIDIGEVASGAVIEFFAEANQVLNPIFYNRTTNEFFGLNFDMYLGDKIIVNTQQGQKSVKLIREGVTTNILTERMDGSSWIQFEPGLNEISYGADEGAENLRVTVSAVRKYEGV